MTGAAGHRPYRIADVTVVDPRDGTTTPHQDVHVAGGRITAVTGTVGMDDGAVAGEGRFAVPGYVDMHSHALGLARPDAALALMLAAGITGYRQMAGGPALLERRSAFGPGKRRPRLLSLCGTILTPVNAGSPDAAVAEVRRQHAQGADFVKAALITPAVYFPAQAEANRLGIPVLGHLPAGIDVRAASGAGFRCIEHVGPGLGVIAGCSCVEQDVLAAAPPRTLPVPPVRLPLMDRVVERMIARMAVNPALLTKPPALTAMQRAIDTFDEERARELARRFAADGVWNCPTLIRLKTQELCHDPQFPADPDLRSVTPTVRRTWQRAARRFAARFTSEQLDTFAAQFALQLRLVKLLDEEGVGLLAGTDAVGAAWVVPGASMHDEFALLAEAGLTPLRVLQLATTEPARFLGRADVAGTVEAGKDADLVLLDADPTESVAHLREIGAVVVGGVVHERDELEALQDEVRVG